MSSPHAAASATGSSATATATVLASSASSSDWQSQTLPLLIQYPLQLWWFVASLMALVIITHVSSLLVATLRRRGARKAQTLATATTKEAGEVFVPDERLSPLHRRLANAVNACRIVLYRHTISLSPWGSSRLNITEFLFGAVYLAATLSWCFLSMPLGARNFAHRAGFTAVSQTPLVVGLAGKNNVISFITGVPPEKLQVLHRSSALTLLVLSLIHAFTDVALRLYGQAIYQPRMIYGVVALVAFVLATILASRFVRDRFYELFLISHIVLILIFLVGAALHMPAFSIYIYIAIGLWGLDRVARVFRLIFFNRVWRSAIPRHRPNSYTQGRIERLSEDTLRLIVPRRMQWKAGQYAYVILPDTSTVPFEAHPFTIASAALQKGENDLVFIIRARDGCTKRLLGRATEGKDGRAEITALIDGPYGCPPSLTQFSTVVLIAGGSGVSYALAQLSSLIHGARSSAVQRVLFVWIVRHASHIQWIASAVAELLTSVSPELDVQIGIWVTQRGPAAVPRLTVPLTVAGNPSGKSLTNEKTLASHRGSLSSVSPFVETKSVLSWAPTVDTTATEDIELVRFSQVRIHAGRPDMEFLLNDEIHGSSGPVSVDVCGPAGLAQEVRSTLAKWDVVGVGKEVELHVETFGW